MDQYSLGYTMFETDYFVFCLWSAVRKSKCRHIQGTMHHPKTAYTNLKKVCKTVPGESDMFAANEKRCAVPLDGPGGDMHVLEVSQARQLTFFSYITFFLLHLYDIQMK